MSAVIKRGFDIITSLLAVLVLGPVILVAMLLVWIYDRQNPIYVSFRVGRNGRPFQCYKLRSMSVGADRTAVDTTIKGDPRITPIGNILRRHKLDELPQLWNVLIGDMSLVGPRPNVQREVDIYTAEERRMLVLRPGITDFSSIIFSDLGDLLAGASDANIAYNQLVRPWKSRLILHYLDHRSLAVDVLLVVLTATGIVSSRRARAGATALLEATGASRELVEISRRSQPLLPTPPPGSEQIVTAR